MTKKKMISSNIVLIIVFLAAFTVSFGLNIPDDCILYSFPTNTKLFWVIIIRFIAYAALAFCAVNDIYYAIKKESIICVKSVALFLGFCVVCTGLMLVTSSTDKISHMSEGPATPDSEHAAYFPFFDAFENPDDSVVSSNLFEYRNMSILGNRYVYVGNYGENGVKEVNYKVEYFKGKTKNLIDQYNYQLRSKPGEKKTIDNIVCNVSTGEDYYYLSISDKRETYSFTVYGEAFELLNFTESDYEKTAIEQYKIIRENNK